MKFCPIDWTGKRYQCCFYAGMDSCTKQSGGCIPQNYEAAREALKSKGYPIETIREML